MFIIQILFTYFFIIDFRFLLSLADTKCCLVIDDQLNVLPLSSHMSTITPVPPKSKVCQREIGEGGGREQRISHMHQAWDIAMLFL